MMSISFFRDRKTPAAQNQLQVLKVLERQIDILLNPALLGGGLNPEDIEIKTNFSVTMDLHADGPGYNRAYDQGIRKLVYGFAEGVSAEQLQPLGAIKTVVVVASDTWTIQIGKASYRAKISGLTMKPRDRWTLSHVRCDDYYESNPFRSLVIWVNGNDRMDFSVVI